MTKMGRTAEYCLIAAHTQNKRSLLAMRKRARRALGSSLVLLANQIPSLRRPFSSLGLRTSWGVFGDRIVNIPMNGRRSFRLTHLDESYLAFQLFWRGADYYEPITRELIQLLLNPGDTFVDVGAHIGFYSMAVAVSVPEVRVVAFEPNPRNFRTLAANVAANGLADAVCEPIAISEKEGTANLYLTESDMSASLMKDFQAEDTQQIGSISVRTASLDSYLRNHSIENLKVIKVDIEGHESAFFRGAMQTISTDKPDIVLEVLYEQDPEILSWLRPLGYRFYPVTNQGLVEMDPPRLVKRFPLLFLNHLLSVRPKHELAPLFDRIATAARKLDLLKTSKHFPKREWPQLWQNAFT